MIDDSSSYWVKFVEALLHQQVFLLFFLCSLCSVCAVCWQRLGKKDTNDSETMDPFSTFTTTPGPFQYFYYDPWTLFTWQAWTLYPHSRKRAHADVHWSVLREVRFYAHLYFTGWKKTCSTGFFRVLRKNRLTRPVKPPRRNHWCVSVLMYGPRYMVYI